MKKNAPALIIAIVLGASCASLPAEPKVEEQVVGPVSDNAKYFVSPHGAHLATVMAKGSRINVIVDGVAGPKFDEIVETTVGYIDSRPYENTTPNQHPLAAQVTFSRDGNRYAYLARLGQEWVLMADNHELLRIPVAGAVGASGGVAGNAGNTEIRLEFSGETGKHLLFARSTYGGNELWVDGQKWPGFYFSGGTGKLSLEPLISPDGNHIVYLATLDTRGEKRALFIDGKDAGYFGEQLQFTPEGNHLICLSQTPKGQSVLIDGKPLFTARQIREVYVPPVGNRLIFAVTHFSKDGNSAEGTFLLVDGKPVEATLTPDGGITRVIFSPDGKHYAAICGKTGRQFVVADGKKGQEYMLITDRDLANLAQGITFSPDSSKLAYVARISAPTNNGFVVINGDESDGLGNARFWFSHDGQHVAYSGLVDERNLKALLMIDGHPHALEPGWYVDTFAFSPDGSRHAFHGIAGGNQAIFLDDKKTDFNGKYDFSADSKHFLVLGGKPTEDKRGLWVDGQLIYKTTDSIRYRTFSPDSQHLIWYAFERAKQPLQTAYDSRGEHVVYVDGKRVAAVDTVTTFDRLNSEGSGEFDKTSRSWEVAPDGVLRFIGPVGDVIKRFTVTPSPDTSVTSLIADVQAAEAKAITDAKAAKEKAEADKVAAAQAKAKADADAAAKAKADYDAAVAKKKADYEAAVAKKKADFDAAMAARAELLKQQQQKK